VNSVLSFLEPYSRTVHFLSRTDVPVASKKVTVDPYVAFLEVFKIKVGVSRTIQVDECSGKSRILLGRLSPFPVEHILIDIDFIDIPLELSSLVIVEGKQSFAISLHGMIEVDMSHRFHHHKKLTNCFLAFNVQLILSEFSAI